MKLKAVAVVAACAALGGCAAQQIQARVKAECDTYGWESPQCEYAQAAGLTEQAQSAAKGRQMIRTGSHLYLFGH